MFELSKLMLDYNSHNLEARRAIASADNIPVEVLEKLSEDPDSEVRRSVASNPITPIEILQKLGKEFPEAITNNPIFNILLLEDPNNEFVRLSLARSLNTSQETLTRLASEETEESEIFSEEYIYERLEYNYEQDEQILWAIANNTNTPIDVFEELDDTLLAKVASKSDNSLQLSERLASAPSGYVRSEVASNRNTSPQVLEKLASDEDYHVRFKVAENCNTSPQVLEKLASDEDYHVRFKVAGNRSTSPQVLKKLASDRCEFVRSRIPESLKR